MLTAIPEDGYMFDGWTGDIGSFSKTICVTFDSDVFLSASFSKIPPDVRFSLSTESFGNGNLEITPLRDNYSNGETVNLCAVPDDGFLSLLLKTTLKSPKTKLNTKTSCATTLM